VLVAVIRREYPSRRPEYPQLSDIMSRRYSSRFIVSTALDRRVGILTLELERLQRLHQMLIDELWDLRRRRSIFCDHHIPTTNAMTDELQQLAIRRDRYADHHSIPDGDHYVSWLRLDRQHSELRQLLTRRHHVYVERMAEFNHLIRRQQNYIRSSENEIGLYTQELIACMQRQQHQPPVDFLQRD